MRSVVPARGEGLASYLLLGPTGKQAYSSMIIPMDGHKIYTGVGHQDYCRYLVVCSNPQHFWLASYVVP